jgi:hypothetical protein
MKKALWDFVPKELHSIEISPTGLSSIEPLPEFRKLYCVRFV